MPVLLPFSPVIEQFSPKISLVDRNYHFIFNVIDKQELAFFNPPPPPMQVQQIELYETGDYLEKVNLSTRKMEVVRRFTRQMEKYLKHFKGGVNMEVFKGNKELLEKLKSLGYLGN